MRVVLGKCKSAYGVRVGVTGRITIAFLTELLTTLENPPVSWSDLAGQAD
jgi:hypothetical protein